MKKLFKKIICLTLAVMFVLSVAACGGGNDDKKPFEFDKLNGRRQTVVETDTWLVKPDGTTDYAILLPEQTNEPLNYAANEIVLRMQEATGVTFNIVKEATTDIGDNTKFISLGATSIAEESGITYTREDLTRNGFRIMSYKDAILILAPTLDGIQYGAYRFLEEQIDYMYYAPTEVRVGDYRETGLKLKSFNYEDWPDFLNRVVFNYDTNTDNENALRLYNNVSSYSVDDQANAREGSWWASLHDQSLALQIVDYNKYNAKNPTWYIGGPVGQAATNPQICYTQALYSREAWTRELDASGEFVNPETFEDELAMFNAGDWSWLDVPEDEYASADAPHGMFWTFMYNLINNYIKVETNKSLFQLGMSDNSTFCACPVCQRDLAKFGGSRSALAFRFANAVADVVEAWRQKFAPEREIYLTMFAYLSIVDPPTEKTTDKDGNPIWVPIDPSVVARDNIVVRYAPIQDYYLFPLLDEENNPASYNAMNGWKAVAKNFAVWDYRIAFGDMLGPFPQWMSNYDNIKAYYDYGFIDVFHQGCRTFGNTAFVTVDNYVRSRLLWNVNQEYEALMHDAITAYYGEAGPMMEEYLEYTTLHYMNFMNKEFNWKAHSHQSYINAQNFPRGYVLNVEDIFERAYEAIEAKKATDPERYKKLKFRLDAESVSLRYLQLSFYTNFYTKEELVVMIDEFERIIGETKILGINTFGGIEGIIAGFRNKVV